jgi:hypothetical protein
VFVEAAWHAMRTPGPLRIFGGRVASKRGSNVAVVAVARKLLVIAWHLLSREEEYAFTRPSLVREKIRRLELLTGTGTARHARGATRVSASRQQRDLELELARQAERVYARLVKDWQPAINKGAGAAPGGAHLVGRQAAKQRGRSKPQRSYVASPARTSSPGSRARRPAQQSARSSSAGGSAASTHDPGRLPGHGREPLRSVLPRQPVADVTTADIDAYVAAKRRAGLGARTLNIHVTRLGSIFDTARRQGLIPMNPVSDAERPRVAKSRWTILSPVEIQSVMRTLDELIAEADDTERAWLQTAKAIAIAMQFAWLRRGELLGLRWCDIELSHPDGPRLHVRETWVRGHRSEPKTDDGARTIACGSTGAGRGSTATTNSSSATR